MGCQMTKTKGDDCNRLDVKTSFCGLKQVSYSKMAAHIILKLEPGPYPDNTCRRCTERYEQDKEENAAWDEGKSDGKY